MSDKATNRTTIYPAREARQHLDVIMDQVIDCRDEPVLIQRPGKEPVALVAASELADWLETAAYPGKYAEDENAGDAEHNRLARLLDALETDRLLCSALTIEAIKEARKGGLPRFTSVQDLFDDLHADD